MSDLEERLRAQVPYQGKSNIAFLCHEAADALEAQEARIEQLEAALRGIADYDYAYGQHVQRLKRKARQALGDTQ